MQLYLELQKALENHKKRNAFFINGFFYSYADLVQSISKIRKSIQVNITETEKNVGLITNDDLETYASIIALWLEGKAYVPLSQEIPKDRNRNNILQADIKTIIDSSDVPLFPELNCIPSKNLRETKINIIPKKTLGSDSAYILFTSGTTGQPKGVVITRDNLSNFVDSFWKLELTINENDRCLQMFELTFDLSIMSYLIPLLRGACIYTIPKDKMKYAFINELMDEHNLTFALMVPSILHFLRPYFDEIHCPDMKYSLFCGEALHQDIVEEWSKCLPNAKIINLYGPTENTIFCTYYNVERETKIKSKNGICSIGKPMNGTFTLIIDDNNLVLPEHEVGQLCLGGTFLSPGYLNNADKNKESFFVMEHEGKNKRFYKTGDLCYYDEEGDIFYLGRTDFQTKISGFRVELSEIEFHVKTFLEKKNAIALTLSDEIGNKEIGLVVESETFNIAPLLKHLKTKIPVYMIPRRIEFIDTFPINTNGKTDRKKLELLF